MTDAQELDVRAAFEQLAKGRDYITVLEFREFVAVRLARDLN